MVEKPTDRDYVVVSKKYVHGRVGDIVALSLTDNQELSLLESGAVKRVEQRRPVAVDKKEGKPNG